MKKLLVTAFFIAITNFSGIKILAQEDISPFVVNEIIGDTLSLEERDHYQLFPQVEGFQSAVFYLNADSTLNAEVYYYEDGTLTDTLIQNYRTLKNLNYHIYARDALENGIPANAFEYKATLNNKGANVSVYIKDEYEVSGELLSVREKSLLLLNPGCDERLLKPECINNIKTSEIDKLTIKGNSNVVLGVSLGLLASVVVGAIIYQSNYKSSSTRWGPPINEEAVVSIGVATAGCIIIGTAIGILTSTPDEDIKIYSEKDIRGLRSYSRYPEDEPNQLKKIQ
jgi:hypothetical protein